MEMAVMMPSPAIDFNFDSACTTPYVSSPSSPQSSGNANFFFSAPTSPSRGGSESTIPFDWEKKPRVPKPESDNTITDEDDDFEFEFSGQLERTSVSADELFDGGKIKPLKPPPRLQLSDDRIGDSPKSPRSPISTKKLIEALSPRLKKRNSDPVAVANEQCRRERNPQEQRNDQKLERDRGSERMYYSSAYPREQRNDQKLERERGRETVHNSSANPHEQKVERERGRERAYDSSASSRRSKGTRSLSPFRVCDLFFDSNSTSNSSKPNQPSSSFSKLYKKWKLKDLLLFRSASEGTGKDQLNKYSVLKKSGEEVKCESFRSTDSGVGSVSMRRRGLVTAHERHYTANRAVAEEMRRKTVLPYKHGLLGWLGLNPAIHGFSRGLGSLARG